MNALMTEPFFFGPAECALFGVYHPPRVQRNAAVGVVLCPPWGQEAIRAHRGFLF